jgi:uncharacterized protein (DUF58 family)
VAGTVAALAVLAFPSLWLLLLAFNLVLVGTAFLDWWITPGAHVLEIVRTVPERMSVLAEHPVIFVVRNRSPYSLWLRLRDTMPLTFRAATEQLEGTVPGRGEIRLEYKVVPASRGRFSWGPVQLRYRSLLGLWEIARQVDAPRESRVYPNLTALQRYHLLARSNRMEVMGIRKVRLRGGAWEFESLRDYTYGDDVRLIDWKATARRRKPIIRNQEAERNQTVLLLVDSGRLMNAEVDGGSEKGPDSLSLGGQTPFPRVAKLDHAINTALLLAHIALSRGDRVGLCTFSSRVHAWVAPRSHLAQMRLLTETLYNLRGDFTETDHGRCLRLLAARHSKRALLVVLTDFVDAQTSAEMVAHLQLAARRHLVLFTALKDPFLDRAAHAFPRTPLEGFRKAAAVDLLRERREVLERLRQRGAHVLDTEPAELTAPLINHYLEITFRGLL